MAPASMTPASPRMSESGFLFPKIALPTYTGYLSTSFPAESTRSRLFFTFYEATQRKEKNVSETPLILWLNGGPGRSSQIGNFFEIGPWRVAGPDGVLQSNDFTWNHEYGLLFVDTPAGTGFSVATTEEDIPTTLAEETEQIFNALSAFFALHPQFKTRPFFIAGESFGGSIIPALADHIVKERVVAVMAGASFPFQLKGVAIGNGLIDPSKQVLTWGETLHSLGLLDQTQRRFVDQTAEQIVALIECDEWVKATGVRQELVNWIEKETAIATVLDVRRTVAYHCTEDGVDFLASFMNKPEVKAVLKADPDIEWVSQNASVLTALQEEVTKGGKHNVENLLAEGIAVLLFQGQFDVKNGPASNEAWLRALEWDGAYSFWKSPRAAWKVGSKLAGYRRSHGLLSHVIMLNAGLMVPADQTIHAKIMIDTWLQGVVPAVPEPTDKEEPEKVPEEPTTPRTPGGGWFNGWFSKKDIDYTPSTPSKDDIVYTLT